LNPKDILKFYPFHSRLCSEIFKKPSEHICKTIKTFILTSHHAKVFHLVHELIVLLFDFCCHFGIFVDLRFNLFTSKIEIFIIEFIKSLIKVFLIKLLFFHFTKNYKYLVFIKTVLK